MTAWPWWTDKGPASKQLVKGHLLMVPDDKSGKVELNKPADFRFLPLKITPGFLGAERLIRASAVTWWTSQSKSGKASLRRKPCLLRKPPLLCVSLLLGTEKPSNGNPTDRFGLLSTRLQRGFKGSFMWGLCIHSCILVSWGVNPFSYHWQPSQGKRLNALVSGVRAKEDQRVSKPVNHGGTSANSLHKLLWQRGVARLTGQMVEWSVPMLSPSAN